jgi:hypothetical protein
MKKGDLTKKLYELSDVNKPYATKQELFAIALELDSISTCIANRIFDINELMIKQQIRFSTDRKIQIATEYLVVKELIYKL